MLGSLAAEQPSSRAADRPVLREQRLRHLPATRKPSFLVLKQKESAEMAPVAVDVGLEGINFRSETKFGLYEAVMIQAVIVSQVAR